MSDKFKKLADERRAAIPQVDAEAVKPPEAAAPMQPEQAQPPVEAPHQEEAVATTKTEPPSERPIYLTKVATSEQPTNRGFFMYPSRHQQVARDLAYIENRNPWKIIEDALEEYVVRRYGKGYRRK